MAKKGLPKQGTQALINAISDANEMIINQKKDNKRAQENADFRDYVNGKKKGC